MEPWSFKYFSSYKNKTKFSRLYPSYEVRELKETWDKPEIDLRHSWERKMKIQCCKQNCAEQTDKHKQLTPLAPDGAKKGFILFCLFFLFYETITHHTPLLFCALFAALR